MNRLRGLILNAAILLACVLPLFAQPGNPLAKPLPKACWDPSLLQGKDTLFVFVPCRDLRVLHPEFRARLECTLDRMWVHGRWIINGKPSTLVAETKRSNKRQQALHGSGRPGTLPYGRPGPIVTNAKDASQSAHGQGKAADLVHFVHGYKNQRFFDSLEDHAFTCGLESGNGWVRLRDGPHLELRNWRRA